MNDIYKICIDIGEAFIELAEAIVEAWDTFITPLKEFCEVLETVKVPEKKSYIPVKKIMPNKLILLNKGLNIYYCRNNC
ncbi:hypothetical protein [Tissierella sp. Yu-01]|uniref:hypothetical protein n=1 Tax=Tissierella sp. Yu-01 TaxID=3035694 RepID=UPI00240D106B|nr:hypothetical protein [Tissierella sp. Yu-01]WFA10341.1 hypothetical protein P3962_07255 [Tissierella sp. Yu-01]